MTTTADLIRQAESYLYSTTRPERDKLGGSYTSGATTLTTTYQRPAIKAGARLSIDLEDFHVWSVSGATVTVKGADNGSAAAAHSNGADIIVNAEYTPFEVFREINNELRALSSPANGLYRVSTVDLTFNSAYSLYDLTSVTNVEGIATVYGEVGVNREWVPISGWSLVRDADTDVFASGFALDVPFGWPGKSVRVAYRRQFATLSSLTDNVETVSGIPSSATDIVSMGAALRLAGVAEIDRNQLSAQGNSRRANEVPAGSRANAVRFPFAQYKARIVEESARLKQAYPTVLPRRY